MPAHSIFETLPAFAAPGAYIDPTSGMSLGSLRDINNPMMRGNNRFNWNMDTAMYETVELTDAQMTVWDHLKQPTLYSSAAATRERIDIAAVDYVPSLEPEEPEPYARRPGYHHIIAADIRRGDLFFHPRRANDIFPVNSRTVGESESMGSFVRLEYIDLYDYDQPDLDWVPTSGDDHNPSFLLDSGFDYTPSGGLASVVLYPEQWIYIRDRPIGFEEMGPRSEGVSRGGAASRYRWFYDNDTFTYNLLNSMFVIGKGSLDYDPENADYEDFFGEGDAYLDLANAFLTKSKLADTSWQDPAQLIDRPFMGDVELRESMQAEADEGIITKLVDLSEGQMVVDTRRLSTRHNSQHTRRTRPTPRYTTST